MGYDAARFVGLGDLEEALTCSICIGIFDDPVVTPCGHTFCKDCIVRWFQQERSCPSCRKTCYKLCRPPIVVTKIIGRQQVRCAHEGKGCKQVVELDQLRAHLEQCPQRPRENAIRVFFKNFFNLTSSTSNALSERSLDYDGELINELDMRPFSRRTHAVEPQDTRGIIVKLVVLMFLFIFGVLSIKAILWTYSIMSHVVVATVGVAGLSIFELIKQVVEKMIIAAISFAVSLVFIFITSTFFALYNY